MKITLLLPTRNNVEALNIAVQAYFDNADNPDDIETIIGVDGDDPRKSEVFAKYQSAKNTKIIEFPVRHTYKRLHLYYNEMYKHGTGDYFLQTSDDAKMLTKGWDTILSEYKDAFNLVVFDLIWVPEVGEPYHHGGFIFHATPRDWCEAIGGFGETPHLDSWTAEICKYLGTKGYPVTKWDRRIRVEHNLKTMYGGRKNGNIGDPDSFHKAMDRIHEQAEMIIRRIKEKNLKI